MELGVDRKRKQAKVAVKEIRAGKRGSGSDGGEGMGMAALKV